MGQTFTVPFAQHLSKPIIPYVTEGLDLHPHLIAAGSLIMIGGGELAELPQMLEKLGRPPFQKQPVLLHIAQVAEKYAPEQEP